MRKQGKLFGLIVLLFALIFLGANTAFELSVNKQEDRANIFMNRFFTELQESISSAEAEQIEAQICRLMQENAYEEEAKESAYGLPERIVYLPVETGNSEVALINRSKAISRLWALHYEDRIIGFVIFEYTDPGYMHLKKVMNLGLAAAFLVTLLIGVYIHTQVLKPFNKLAAYPEKISKNEISEKLPESKNRMFGRFVWGINMLSDRLESDKKRIHELSKDHLTMMTTIAHGIKTPVANIKLYADAIATGLYQPNGQINEKDAEIAEKISKNADEVADLVRELIDKASGGIVNFEPKIETFYLEEVKTFLQEEFAHRLELLRVPFHLEMGHNAMIKSDKCGICRILAQLMENAIKYGNGEGIAASIEKESDGYYLAVKNKGRIPDENELPYLFNSFWRGSNAQDIYGSGIGLYEAREIARKLYGDIYVKTDPEKEEIEFDVFLPL